LIPIFLCVKFKPLANTPLILLVMAFVAYVAGLFAPQVPFMDFAPALHDLFSPGYYLCYWVLAIVWAVLACWKYNRSWGEGLLAGSLIILCLVLTYLSARIEIAPADTVFPKGTLYISLIAGFGAFYYAVSRQMNDRVFMPILLLLFAVGGLWLYSISGVQARIQSNVQSLVAYTKSKPLADANAQVEKAFGINTGRSVLASLNTETEYSYLSEEEAQNRVAAEISPLTKNKFDEKMLRMLLKMTANQHQEGRAVTRLHIWHYAYTVPFVAFNETAATNHAYFFLLALLYVFGLLVCVESIFFGEEYE